MIPILIFSLTFAFGDTLKLDLNRAVEMALQKNLDYRVQSLDNTISGLSFYERVTSCLPKPVLQATYSQYETKYGGIVPWEGYLVDLSVSQPIVHIQRFASVWGGKVDLNSSSLYLEEARNSLSYEVEGVYLGVLKSAKTVESQESALKRAEENLRLIETRDRLGQASKLDVLNAQVALNQSKLSLATAKKNSRVQKRLFLHVLGIPETPELVLEPPQAPEEEVEFPPLDSLLAKAFKQRPSLKALNQMVKAANIGLLGGLSAILPTVFFQWSWQYRGDDLPGIDDFGDEDLRSSGLSAGLTFDILSYPFEVQKLRKTAEKARTQLKRQRLLVAREVEGAYLNYRTGLDNVGLARLTLDAAREGEELAKAQYRLGLIKPLELFDAETRLLDAEADYLSAIYDLHLARSGLKYAVGGGL